MHTQKAKSLAAVLTQLLPPWDACAPQTLEPCVGKSSWDRASNQQEDCPGLTERGHGTQSSTMTSKPLSTHTHTHYSDHAGSKHTVAKVYFMTTIRPPHIGT